MNKTAHSSIGKVVFGFSRGFTMIELLIVIAVLSVLTIAVVSAINPIEQVNRSKDAGRINDAEQLIGAVDRYYTSKGYYPWTISAAVLDQSQAWADVDTTWDDVAGVTVGTQVLKDKLAAGGAAEVKAAFATRLSAAEPRMKVYNRGTSGDSTYVCFNPSSQDFTEKAWNRCKLGDADRPEDFPDATTESACPTTDCVDATTAATATACFYCLP